MPEISEADKFERVLQKFDSAAKLLRTWPLKGGVSAQVTALEAELPGGQTQKLIVRRHGEADLRQNPQVAAHEFRLLQLLHAEGLAAPKPYALDQSGEIFPTPYILVEYVEGAPEFAPADLPGLIRQVAAQLVRIHGIHRPVQDLAFLPGQEQTCAPKLQVRPPELDHSLGEGRIREALEGVWTLPRRNQPTLLHGDFWPGNLLWKEGRLAAVIDWEDAAVGDPLSDVANARLEILWAFGIDAMERFTDLYRSMTTVDFTDLPYWDLYAALRPAGNLGAWGLDPETESRMRERHRWFVARAFEPLSHRKGV